jgi:hypothetical protein
MMSLIALIISIATGWMIIRIITAKELSLLWQITLGHVLGIIFFSFYSFFMLGVFKIFNPWIILGVLLLIILTLTVIHHRFVGYSISLTKVPLLASACYY